MTTTPASPPAGLSRRALFGIGGSTLLLAAAAAAVRRRFWRAGDGPRVRAAAASRYADHDGWIVPLAEKQALQAQAPPGGRP